MDAHVTDIRYRKGLEPVTILVAMPFGGALRVNTSQATLTARAGGGTWGDSEITAIAQDAIDALYPDAALVVS